MRAYVDADVLIWHLRGEPKALKFLRALRQEPQCELLLFCTDLCVVAANILGVIPIRDRLRVSAMGGVFYAALVPVVVDVLWVAIGNLRQALRSKRRP